jgi:class 3 adenylate cyclase
VHPCEPLGGPDEVAAHVASVRQAVVAALTGCGGTLALSSSLAVVATFDEPGEAIAAGLAARLVAFDFEVRQGGGAHEHVFRPLIGVGVGYGPVVAHDGEPMGPEVSRAWRLAVVCGSGDVLATTAAIEAVALPPGVGTFRAPAAQEALAGFEARLLADYRD